jgi:hypothetical protein
MVIGDPRNGEAVPQDADVTATAFDVLRTALEIAQQSGNHQLETHVAVGLAVLTAARGNSVDALGLFTLAIRKYYDSGTFSHMHTPLAWLATYLVDLGYPEHAAVIVGFADDALIRTTYAQMDATATHLREMLGSARYTSLARIGKRMSNGEMASYALEQIDVARAQLPQAGESR